MKALFFLILILPLVSFAEATEDKLNNDAKTELAKALAYSGKDLQLFAPLKQRAETSMEALIRYLSDMNQKAFGTRSDTLEEWLKKVDTYVGYILTGKENEIRYNDTCATCAPVVRNNVKAVIAKINSKIFLTSERKKVAQIAHGILTKIVTHIDNQCAKCPDKK